MACICRQLGANGEHVRQTDVLLCRHCDQVLGAVLVNPVAQDYDPNFHHSAQPGYIGGQGRFARQLQRAQAVLTAEALKPEKNYSQLVALLARSYLELFFRQVEIDSIDEQAHQLWEQYRAGKLRKGQEIAILITSVAFVVLAENRVILDADKFMNRIAFPFYVNYTLFRKQVKAGSPKSETNWATSDLDRICTLDERREQIQLNVNLDSPQEVHAAVLLRRNFMARFNTSYQRVCRVLNVPLPKVFKRGYGDIQYMLPVALNQLTQQPAVRTRLESLCLLTFKWAQQHPRFVPPMVTTMEYIYGTVFFLFHHDFLPQAELNWEAIKDSGAKQDAVLLASRTFLRFKKELTDQYIHVR